MPNSSLCKRDTALSSHLVAMTLARNVLYRLRPSLLAVWEEIRNLKCFSFLTVDKQSAGYGELHFPSCQMELGPVMVL